MRALVIEAFGERPEVRDVDEPNCDERGVILRVEATGLCRSDWHAWQGHDPDVVLPHVPGHEIAGTVLKVGSAVTRVGVGERVTVPFVCACGQCPECESGNGQTCQRQQQPGFTYWGSFAEQVAVPNADLNLVVLPAELDFAAAATLGCRLATAYRAVRQVGAVEAGQTVVVYGCGGLGLSAVVLAVGAGARVVAVDTSVAALDMARQQGAHATVLSGASPEQLALDVAGAASSPIDVTIDAVGSGQVMTAALGVLRPRGRHVQVGLLPGASEVLLGPLIGKELQVLGSHGMAAHGYRAMMAEIVAGEVRPAELVRQQIGLGDVADALAQMSGAPPPGITVIVP